jgi:hypothetical protein
MSRKRLQYFEDISSDKPVLVIGAATLDTIGRLKNEIQALYVESIPDQHLIWRRGP